MASRLFLIFVTALSYLIGITLASPLASSQTGISSESASIENDPTSIVLQDDSPLTPTTSTASSPGAGTTTTGTVNFPTFKTTKTRPTFPAVTLGGGGTDTGTTSLPTPVLSPIETTINGQPTSLVEISGGPVTSAVLISITTTFAASAVDASSSASAIQASLASELPAVQTWIDDNTTDSTAIVQSLNSITNQAENYLAEVDDSYDSNDGAVVAAIAASLTALIAVIVGQSQGDAQVLINTIEVEIDDTPEEPGSQTSQISSSGVTTSRTSSSLTTSSSTSSDSSVFACPLPASWTTANPITSTPMSSQTSTGTLAGTTVPPTTTTDSSAASTSSLSAVSNCAYIPEYHRPVGTKLAVVPAGCTCSDGSPAEPTSTIGTDSITTFGCVIGPTDSASTTMFFSTATEAPTSTTSAATFTTVYPTLPPLSVTINPSDTYLSCWPTPTGAPSNGANPVGIRVNQDTEADIDTIINTFCTPDHKVYESPSSDNPTTCYYDYDTSLQEYIQGELGLSPLDTLPECKGWNWYPIIQSNPGKPPKPDSRCAIFLQAIVTQCTDPVTGVNFGGRVYNQCSYWGWMPWQFDKPSQCYNY